MYSNDLFPTPQHRRDFMRATQQRRLKALIDEKARDLRRTPFGGARSADGLSPEIKRNRRSERKSAYDRFLEAQIKE